MTVYDFEVTDGDGNAVSLSEFKLPRLVEAVDFLVLFWKSTSLIDNGP